MKLIKHLEILEEEKGIKKVNSKETKLFEEYLYKNNSVYKNNVLKKYKRGTSINKLRKELASCDLEYFGKTYLQHYFSRETPKFHRELDKIWIENVIKNKDVLKENEEINKLQGSRVAITAPRGHAKSTNFTFKDVLHASLFSYKKYILILSDSTE